MIILIFMFILTSTSSSHDCLYLTSTISSRDTVQVTGHQRSEALLLPLQMLEFSLEGLQQSKH